MRPVDPDILPPDLARFLALWEQKRGSRRFPRRQDFSFEDLGPWMGRINVMQVEGSTARFLVFSGESARRYGGEMTGKTFADFRPESMAAAAQANHEQFMAGGGIPMMVAVTGPFGERALSWFRLCLPLSTEGKTIDRYFVALQFPADD
jgi:hypothetical protein